MNQTKIPAPCLAFLGTGSDVGKSVLATAMCRVLSDHGVRVSPFKAQNMSNNSGVTPEGLEMGRAQIIQAEASRIAPHVDMNPVLLKPAGKSGSQMVLLGNALVDPKDRAKYARSTELFSIAAGSLDRLRTDYDAVILEGAGSCAEVNLMARDFINLRMAAYAGAPVVLVADIHKGGVFAQIVGTLECLSKDQRAQIAGFIINRFRGDAGLFEDGVRWLEEKTRKPVFGVIPWFDHIHIGAEDSVVIEQPETVAANRVRQPAVAVVRLPHISNFTDVDPLLAVDGLFPCFVEKARDLACFAALILPGSKNTRADMAWLERTGWAERIRTYAASGGNVLGICGGYQMLGVNVSDPDGLEGSPGKIAGLGLLPIETRLSAPKTTTLARFMWEDTEGTGYEIHMGHTKITQGSPMLRITKQNDHAVDFSDGCASADGRVLGTYMHGLFDEPKILEKWLARIGLPDLDVPKTRGLAARDVQYSLLARHFEEHADVDRLIHLMGSLPNRKESIS